MDNIADHFKFSELRSQLEQVIQELYASRESIISSFSENQGDRSIAVMDWVNTLKRHQSALAEIQKMIECNRSSKEL